MRVLRKVAKLLSSLLYGFTLLWPWPIRRWMLNAFFGYKIDRTAKIGLSWIRPRRLVVGKGSYIGHLNVVKGLDDLIIGEAVVIGRMNWITAFPSGNNASASDCVRTTTGV